MGIFIVRTFYVRLCSRMSYDALINKLQFLLLREVISEIVHNLLALVLDFLPTKRAHEGWTLVLDSFRYERILIVEIGDLKLPVGLD